MPLRKKPPTLGDGCLSVLADHLWTLWKVHGNGVLDRDDIRDYYRLPRDIAGRLLALLKDRNRLQCCHLALLVHSGMDTLNLAWYNFNMDFFLKWSAMALQNLLCLDLSFSLDISPSAFQELATCIPRVKVLHLQSTGCSDSVLGLLGAFCPHLRDLDLAWCPVTDLGVMGLCMDLSCPGSSPPRCEKLVRLCVTGTMVTVAGAAFALERLPDLQDLDFVDTFEVLEALHGMDLETKRLETVPKYNLRVLRSTGVSMGLLQRILTPECFKIATTTCPQMSRVVVANANLPVEGLLLLSRCLHLTELELGFGTHGMLAFADVLPLLQVSGFQLTLLTLSELIGVDVTAISTCCPRLRHLSLCNIDGYRHAEIGDKPCRLPELLTLTLVDNVDIPIPVSHLLGLLSHCLQLQLLRLYWCASFTTHLLDRVLHCNPMLELQTVDLESCNHFNRDGATLLLQQEGQLSLLSMQRCRQITRIDYCQMLAYVHRNNLKISIEWIE